VNENSEGKKNHFSEFSLFVSLSTSSLPLFSLAFELARARR
jgi:hypothetical protein